MANPATRRYNDRLTSPVITRNRTPTRHISRGEYIFSIPCSWSESKFVPPSSLHGLGGVSILLLLQIFGDNVVFWLFRLVTETYKYDVCHMYCVGG